MILTPSSIILFFRNFELTLLTMFPIVLTGIVTAGLLWLFGLELNIFSTVVCTLLVGVGDDFSIFLTQAMQKEHTTGKKPASNIQNFNYVGGFHYNSFDWLAYFCKTSCFTLFSFGCVNRNVFCYCNYLHVVSILV